MPNSLIITPVKTKIFRFRQNINEFIKNSLIEQPLREGDIIAVTSKIVSLAEGQVIAKNSIDKDTLIKQEADYDLGEIGYGSRLTIKHGLMIPSAGIDESNSENDEYILYPETPFESAKNIYQFLSEHFAIKNIGIIITDSHTAPLRLGVTGIALSYYGFKGIRNLVGSNDIFKRPLKMTKVNIVDSLAVAAVLMMGEADEMSPLAIIKNAAVEFTGHVDQNEAHMRPEQDMYYPFYKKSLIDNKKF